MTCSIEIQETWNLTCFNWVCIALYFFEAYMQTYKRHFIAQLQLSYCCASKKKKIKTSISPKPVRIENQYQDSVVMWWSRLKPQEPIASVLLWRSNLQGGLWSRSLELLTQFVAGFQDKRIHLELIMSSC